MFRIGSRYSYIAATQLDHLTKGTGATFFLAVFPEGAAGDCSPLDGAEIVEGPSLLNDVVGA